MVTCSRQCCRVPSSGNSILVLLELNACSVHCTLTDVWEFKSGPFNKLFDLKILFWKKCTKSHLPPFNILSSVQSAYSAHTQKRILANELSSSILSNQSDVLFSAISPLPFYLTNQTFVCGLFHICMCTIFPLNVLYLEHLQLIFSTVSSLLIA